MAKNWASAWLAALLALAGALPLAPLARAADCCTITSINLRTGIVTAEDAATRRRYEIVVANAVLLNRLRRGQAVDVDAENRKATIEGVAGRFSLYDEAAARAEAEQARAPVEVPARPASQVAPAAEAERFEAPAPPPIPERRAEYSPAEPSYNPPMPYSDGERAAPAPAAPRPDSKPARGRDSMRDKPTRRDPRAQDPPNDDANDDNDPDPPKMQRSFGKGKKRGGQAGKMVRLDKYPDARGFLKKVGEAFARREINVALIGGEKYMINKCLGIKVRAGSFKLRLANPSAKLEGSGAKLTFRVERVSLNGISLRMRPNSNVLKPCHFSKKFSVGGSASNVRLEWSFDPVMDVTKCKLGSVGRLRARVDIGNLNLKPLQNDLDRIAKNMIEDALNYAFEFDPTDQILQTVDDVLEADCPGKRAQIG